MVVKTYTTKRGATVRIFDDDMAVPGTKEEARVIREQNQIAAAILRKAVKSDKGTA